MNYGAFKALKELNNSQSKKYPEINRYLYMYGSRYGTGDIYGVVATKEKYILSVYRAVDYWCYPGLRVQPIHHLRCNYFGTVRIALHFSSVPQRTLILFLFFILSADYYHVNIPTFTGIDLYSHPPLLEWNSTKRL